MKILGRIFILVVFASNISVSKVVAQTDSIIVNGYLKNRKYPHRSPLSLQIGLGVSKYSNDITIDPIYNKYKNENGFYKDLNLSIPIPFTRFLAVSIKNCNIESISSNVEENTNQDAFTFGNENYLYWQQFDPNDQYGVLSYLNNSFFFVEYTSLNYYKLSKSICFGPSLYLPLNKRWSNFIYFSYNIGTARLTSYKIEKNLSQDLLFYNGNADYSLITNEMTQKVRLQNYEGGFYLTAGKHLGLTFGGSYSKMPIVTFNYKTELQSSDGTVLNTKYKNSQVSYNCLNLFMRIGVRF